jgi:hypothetical protein
MVASNKKIYYARSGGKTVAVYAVNRKQAKEKFQKLNYKLQSVIVSVDEWCR